MKRRSKLIRKIWTGATRKVAKREEREAKAAKRARVSSKWPKRRKSSPKPRNLKKEQL